MMKDTTAIRSHGAIKEAEVEFRKVMLALYDRCATLGFRPVLLRRIVLLSGGVAAARQLIQQPGQTGLEKLQKHGQAQFSMEATMLRPEFQALFTPVELAEAKRLLASAIPSRSRGRLAAAVTVKTEKDG